MSRRPLFITYTLMALITIEDAVARIRVVVVLIVATADVVRIFVVRVSRPVLMTDAVSVSEGSRC